MSAWIRVERVCLQTWNWAHSQAHKISSKSSHLFKQAKHEIELENSLINKQAWAQFNSFIHNTEDWLKNMKGHVSIKLTKADPSWMKQVTHPKPNLS